MTETYTFTAPEARKIARHMPAAQTRDMLTQGATDAGKGGTVAVTVSPGLEGGRLQLRFACLKAGVKIPKPC